MKQFEYAIQGILSTIELLIKCSIWFYQLNA